MTKEEILKKHGLQIGFKSTYLWNAILESMEEYAQQKTSDKVLNLFRGGWICDGCGCHPNTIYTTSKGIFCEKCKPNE